MKAFIWIALFTHLFSFYSLARYSQLEELETKIRIQYAQTAIDSKDREIGIKRYSDPSVFPMIGWRGMIIETDDREDILYRNKQFRK